MFAPARFVLSAPAESDIDGIWDFTFEESKSLAIADRAIAAIYAAFDLLAEFPSAGHPRDDLTDRDLRFWNVGRHLIAYNPGSDPIQIVAVIGGGRDIEPIIERQ